MSLINDALKRTKDVQHSTPSAADGPALRPVAPEQAKAGSGAKTLLFVMVVAVIAGNVFLWLAFKDRGTQQAVPSKPVSASAATLPAAATPPPPAETAPAASVAEPTVAPDHEEAPAVVPGPAANVAMTNVPEAEPKVVFAAPPQPTVLRLQSIIYGSRPSAMIAGKFLFVGDSIQGHKVIDIDKETVTLVGEGQTNVLSLP